MDNVKIRKNARELENFVKKAKRKLLEFEVMQSEWETANGKVAVFKNASTFMKHIKTLVR